MKKSEIENRFREEGLKDMSEIDIRAISSNAILPQKTAKTRVPKRAISFAVAVVAVLIIGVTVFSGVYFGSTDTIVTIEVNPAISFAVTPANTVKSVTMLNEDAAKLFDESKIKSKTVDEATDYIFNTLYNAGYMENDNDVSVTVNGKNQKKAQKVKEKVKGKCNGWAHGNGKN